MAEMALTIGGSEIAAICGWSPFAGPVDIYNRMINGEAPKQSLKMSAGVHLEAGIVTMWLERHGLPAGFAYVPKEKSYFREGWMRASPDRLTTEGGALEIKFSQNSDGAFGRTGSMVWPLYYKAQCAWYRMVLDLNYVRLVALIYGTPSGRAALRLAEYEYVRDEKLENTLYVAGKNFYENNILRRVPPPGAPVRPQEESLSFDDWPF